VRSVTSSTGGAAAIDQSPVRARPVRTSRLTSTQSERLWAVIFLTPWIIGFLGLLVGPMLWSLWLSFTDYDPLVDDAQFLGLENYREAFSDRNVHTSLRNTLFYTVIHVPLTLTIGLSLAIMLTKVRRLSGVFRTVFYLPNVTPAVAVGTLFLLLLNAREGLINKGLGLVGIDGPSWLTDPSWIKFGVIMMMAWTVGTTVVIFFAALQNVPRTLYEAAAIDGASAWGRFRNVTLPMISGTLFFLLVINTIASLQLFTEVYTVFFGAQPTSASNDAALFYVVYLFQQGFEFFNMGYASALAWLLFIVIGVITAIQVRLSKRWVYYEQGD
jgi:multiple sugar transport system permease protein